MQDTIKTIIDTLIPSAKSLAFALIILIAGLVIIRFIRKRLVRVLPKSKIDPTLQPFLLSVSDVALKIFLVLSIVAVLGIDTSSVVAVIASAGFAIGLAFQGSLANFAGGILLLIVKPFKVGDFIESEGFSGTVRGIKILYTELQTVDNKVIFIPNGKISNASITNFSANETRRLDLKFGVGYGSDIDRVKAILMSTVRDHPYSLTDPEPFVRLSEHADSALIFTVRVWALSENYWALNFDLIETVKKRFDENSISIPYPQLDVHMEHH